MRRDRIRTRELAFGPAWLGTAVLGLGLLGPAVSLTVQAAALPREHDRPRNVIIFIADGLRRGSVNATDAPTMLRMRREGVDFANSHAVFPTVTTANASAIATGHQLGDTGDFANALYFGFPIFDDGKLAGRTPGSITPFLESDPVLSDVTGRFVGANYLGEESLLALARRHGYQTAAIGKLGPVAIQDVTEIAPQAGSIPARATVVIDDVTGTPSGVALDPMIASALAAAGLPLATPPRVQPSGTVTAPGTTQANVDQQRYFIDATTRVILPIFRANGRPFALVYWSRDPDGTQHNQGDSLNTLTPGINGPTSRAAVANADANLRQILDWLDANPEVGRNTDVLLTSDHGFATISKHEIDAVGHATAAWSTQFTYLGPANDPKAPEVVRGWLPPGFLALDLAHALQLPLYDPDSPVTIDGTLRYGPVDPAQPNSGTSRQHPVIGNGLVGGTGAIRAPPDAKLVITANGGSDLIYVPDHDAALVRATVAFLRRQDYVGALFVDSRYGRLPGALSLKAIGLEGRALTPRPAVVVSFRTFSIDPKNPLQSAVQIADTPLQEGQGMHGALSRDNTWNNMAASGPDFKHGYVDDAPVSNADLTPTLARSLGWKLSSRGALAGRILVEALPGGRARLAFEHRVENSESSQARGDMTGVVTRLEYQLAAGKRYLDGTCTVGTANHDTCR